MKILITGATGFIGFHLARRLAADGHAIVAAARDAGRWQAHLPAWEWRPCDFSRDTREADWTARVADVDLVINAVGIISESGTQTFARIQAETPQALFSACSRAGVKVIQISALGAERPEVATPFLASKRQADDHLWRLPGECVIVHPAIVIGRGGNSTALFCRLAALPLVPLPGQGDQRLNPVHVDDLCETLAHLVAHWPGGKQRHLLTGADVLPLRDLLALLRDWLGLGRARFLPVPLPLLRFAARAAERVAPASLLQRDALAMLDDAATPAPTYAARPPRPLAEALWSRPAQPADAGHAQLAGLQPVLVASLAFVWIFTGLVSALWSVAAGQALLASAGITGPLALLLIYGGGVFDLALGLLMLSTTWRRRAYALQIGLMLVYMTIISVLLPASWLDPLGSVSKNLPLLALTGLLLALEPRRRR